MEKKPMGMYVHIPFCSKKCDYCDFVSFSMDKKAQQQYLQGLFAEIDMVKKDFYDETFDTLYIGGGTPSILYEGFIASLTRKLYSSFHFAEKTEFTIECNPSSFTREKFFEYVEAGVNRISIGVQCLDSKLLHDHGRYQTMESVNNTFKILKDSEFPNVNGDVMLGLPGQSVSSVLSTVNYLIQQRCKHISVYSLQVEKHTALYEKVSKGKVHLPNDERTLKIYNKVCKVLKDNGFNRYEVSNFAKPSFESKHNLKYWQNVDYLGLGVAAHSYINGYRYHNTKRLDTYMDNLKNDKSPIYEKEYVTDNEKRTERIMLALRTKKGLNLKEFKQEFNEDLLKTKTQELRALLHNGMLEIVDDYLRITEDYFYVSNSIIVELLN